MLPVLVTDDSALAPGARHVAVTREKGAEPDVVTEFDIEPAGDARQPDALRLAGDGRQRLEQRVHLLLDQGTDQQNQCADEQKGQQEHGDDRQRARQAQGLKAVGERISDISQQRRRHEWGQHRREQVQQHAGDRKCDQPGNTGVGLHATPPRRARTDQRRT